MYVKCEHFGRRQEYYYYCNYEEKTIANDLVTSS